MTEHDGLITRPDTLDVPAALEDRRRVRSALATERVAELKELVFRELDLYLEQRLLYKQLIREGRHRGVEPPRRSKFMGANAPSLRAKPTHTEAPSDPTICRPRTGSIATSTSATAPARTSKSPH